MPDTRTPGRGGPLPRLLRLAVAFLSLACLLWVLAPLLTHGRQLAASVDGPRLLLWVAVGAVVYAALGVLLAASWWWLAGIYGRRPPFREGYRVFATSQIAKYLPGNAFHYVSRQVLGARQGLSHPALVASSLLETASLLLAALVTAGVAYGQAGGLPRPATTGGDASGTAAHGALVGWDGRWALAVALFCLLAWPLADRLLRRLPKVRDWMRDLPHLTLGATLRLLGPSLLAHVAFFFGTGLLLLALVASTGGRDLLLGDDSARPIWIALGAYALAWTAGTITVGAPAGVGVREALLTWQLGFLLAAPQAAAAALALRVVTLAGDLLTALAGAVLSSRPPPPEP